MAELGLEKVISVGDLETKLGSKKFPNFVAECEADFKKQVAVISDYVLQNNEINMVFVSGPTSSGKTTFSNLFAKGLTAAGRTTKLISMDDYYKLSEPIYDAEGRPDYESIDTLEMDLLYEDINKIQKMEQVQIPTFDFKMRARYFEAHKVINPQPNDIYMIEGLHGLSSELFQKIDGSRAVKIFIMPNAKLYSDDSILNKTDMRILRRLSRDVFHRGATAISTIDFWPMIAAAEEKFIHGYLQAADFYVNSALPYEYSVIVPKAREQIKISLQLYERGELPPSDSVRPGLYYADLERAVKKANRLLDACNEIPRVNPSVVPADSILQEFI